MSKSRPNISRVAAKLVSEHGADAPLVARLWARCADRAGDPNRHNAWVQIENLVCKIVSCADVTRKLAIHCDKVDGALNACGKKIKTEAPTRSDRRAK